MLFVEVFPACIAIAIASGLPPIYGVLYAAVATFVASALGDSKIRISAPNIVLVATASGIVARSGILGLTLSTLLAVTMFRKALGTSPGRYMAERLAGRL